MCVSLCVYVGARVCIYFTQLNLTQWALGGVYMCFVLFHLQRMIQKLSSWLCFPLLCVRIAQVYQMLTRLPRWLSGKESACQCRRCRRWGFDPWTGKIPWRRKWQPSPVFCPEKSHGQTSLDGYSPWGRKELVVTKQRSMRHCTSSVAKLITSKMKHIKRFRRNW